MRNFPSLTPGEVLLSEPFMEDPNFKRAVVLLCEHKDEGSLGFILNKSLNMSLAEALPELENFDAQLYFGGPVETDTLHFLHTLGDEIEGAIEIAPGLWWGGNFEILSILIKSKQINPDQVRFFLGYSGWSSGQLTEEMGEKAWIPHNGRADYLNSDADHLWTTIMREKGGKYRIMSNYPEDPRYN
jgi:putative transcriptional regulator